MTAKQQPQQPERTTIHVEVGEIRLETKEWKNPRLFTKLDPDSIKEMKDSIKEYGVKKNLDVVQVRDKETGGTFVLNIDGQRRILGAREAYGPKYIIGCDLLREDVIEDFTPEIGAELTLEALNIGTHRAELSGYELTQAAVQLRATNKRRPDGKMEPHTQKEIGLAIDRDHTWVSKMLKAWAAASDDLKLAWRKGDLTDEQFRDLSEAKPEKQAEKAKETTAASKSGDKAGARASAKETAIEAKKEKAAAKPKKPEKPAKGGKAGKTALAPKQREMFAAPEPAAEKKRIKPPSTAMLEETWNLQTKRPPTHDLVKGIFLGVGFAKGEISLENLPKPWHQYIARVGGTGAAPKAKPSKPKPSKPAKPSKGRKAKKR